MNIIHKQKLEVKDEQVISIPSNARILSVQWQELEQSPVIWYEFEKSDNAHREEVIYTITTGMTFIDGLAYLSTYQTGGFTGHIYIKKF